MSIATNLTNDTATNPHGQTGPRTEAGKAASSRNSLKDGLFTTQDFIRPGEEAEYAKTSEGLMKSLTPEGDLEEFFAQEIVSATWRVRRCRLIEAALAFRADDEFTLNEQDEKRQKSADRARTQSRSAIHRAMAELRKLQTEREVRSSLNFNSDYGLADTRQVMKAANIGEKQANAEQKADTDDFEAMLQRELFGANIPGQAVSFCKPAASTPAVSPKTPKIAPAPGANEGREAGLAMRKFLDEQLRILRGAA